MKLRFVVVVLVILAAAAGGYYFFAKKKNDAPTLASAGQAQTSAGKPAAGEATEFWTKRCTPGDKPHCEVFQRLTVSETGQRLAELAIGYPPGKDGKAEAALILPLGVKVSEGVIITVDNSGPLRTPFQTCLPDGCLMVTELPNGFLETLNNGTTLRIAFMEFPSAKQYNVEMSLQGFKQAFADVKPQ